MWETPHPHRPSGPDLAAALAEVESRFSHEDWNRIKKLCQLPTTEAVSIDRLAADAIALERVPLLAFLVHTWLGDGAPLSIRQLARRPNWQSLRPSHASTRRAPPSQLLELLDAPIETGRNLDFPQTLGRFAWLLWCWHTQVYSPTLPPAVYEALRSGPLDEPSKLIECFKDQSIIFDNVSLSATESITKICPPGREGWWQAPERLGPLHAFVAAEWIRPLVAANPSLVEWIADGLESDFLRTEVLARIFPDLSKAGHEALERWTERASDDPSPQALFALLSLDLIRRSHGQQAPASAAARWARCHCAAIVRWIQELVATIPEDVPEDSLEALRCRRRVLERMEPAARLRWIQDHPDSILRTVIRGGGNGGDRMRLWAELLSPDADEIQRQQLENYAKRSRVGRQTLERLGWKSNG